MQDIGDAAGERAPRKQYWTTRGWEWHPTPVLLPGKSHGRRSLVGCSPWGREESDTTEWLHFHFSLSCIGEGNGNPLQCSCLENPRDGGAWWAAVYGVSQRQTWLKWLSSSSRPFGPKNFHTPRSDKKDTAVILAWNIWKSSVLAFTYMCLAKSTASWNLFFASSLSIVFFVPPFISCLPESKC